VSIPGPGHLLVVESMSVLEEVDGAQKNMAFSDFWVVETPENLWVIIFWRKKRCHNLGISNRTTEIGRIQTRT